jgi:hypothetical protein
MTPFETLNRKSEKRPSTKFLGFLPAKLSKMREGEHAVAALQVLPAIRAQGRFTTFPNYQCPMPMRCWLGVR